GRGSPAVARGDPHPQPPRGAGGRRAGGAERSARAAGPRPGVQSLEDRRPPGGARAGGLRRPRTAPGGRIPRARPPRRAPPGRGRGAGRGRRGGHGMTLPLVASALPLPLLRRGKVREVYEVDRETLLLVASDRVSALDRKSTRLNS